MVTLSLGVWLVLIWITVFGVLGASMAWRMWREGYRILPFLMLVIFVTVILAIFN